MLEDVIKEKKIKRKLRVLKQKRKRRVIKSVQTSLDNYIYYDVDKAFDRLGIDSKYRGRIKSLTMPRKVYDFLGPFGLDNLAFGCYNSTFDSILIAPNPYDESATDWALEHEIYKHRKLCRTKKVTRLNPIQFIYCLRTNDDPRVKALEADSEWMFYTIVRNLKNHYKNT